jgi:glycosyltransferase involved in cell wall biosynthesis
VIPAYNAEKHIAEAIDSALSQTFSELEVIVVDDGSTDSTGHVATAYGEHVRYRRQQNRGSGAACGTGVELATGEWIAFLDADDAWTPDKLRLQLEECKTFAISHTDMYYFGEGLPGDVLKSGVSRLERGHVLEPLLLHNFIAKSSVLVRRDVFLEAGGFPSRYHTVEDWPLWLSICARYELGCVDLPLLRYRVHKSSKSMSARKTMSDHKRIIDDAFSEGGVGHAYAHLKPVAYATSYRIHGHYAAEAGDWPFSMYCSGRALLAEPTNLRTWKTLIKASLIPFGVAY